MPPARRSEQVTIEWPCVHATQAKLTEVERPGAGCEECLRTGGRWVHLRACLTCGHIGCCDSSPGRHATKHFRTIGHPIATSVEPGETWVWCFADARQLSA